MLDRPVNRIATPKDWLNYNLKIAGIKQSYVSDRLGVSRNMISMWSKGTQQIPLKHMIKMAEIFGVDPIYARNIYFASVENGYSWVPDERVRLLSSISQNEIEFLEILRKYNQNPKLTEKQREAFIEFVKGLNPEEPTITQPE